MENSKILKLLPYAKPFLFVDEIEEISEDGVIGYYTFDLELDFYKGHFKERPITPGVILTETMAQIGLVCLGIYLSTENEEKFDGEIALTSANVDFIRPVFPGEKVKVISEKIYYRFNKLKCSVTMQNQLEEKVCAGTLAGMFIKRPDE